MSDALQFWFDYHSPWSYLAAVEIEALAARRGREVHWRPLHLPRLIEAIGGRRPLEASGAFVAWYRQDLQDWAALRGVTIRYHPQFPLRPARALRATLYADAQGVAAPFARAVFRAYWTDARDISAFPVLASLGAGVGLDGAAVAAAAEQEGWKAALDANTKEAEARGVFGVPTVDADGTLFFGNDRLSLLEHRLGGDPPR